jgi:hypothetical protein
MQWSLTSQWQTSLSVDADSGCDIHGRKTDKVSSADGENRRDLRSDVTLCSAVGGSLKFV